MFRDHWIGISRTAVAAAVAVVVAAPALAQNTTAGVGGRVLGADGLPVAGASVSILHVESKATSSTVTDANGRWSARGLRVGGPYTITVSRAGTTDTRNGIFLQLAETLNVDSLLGARSETVVVTGSRVLADRFGTSAMGAGTSISSRELGTLASMTGNLQDFARIDPRISQTDKERGEISALGQNSRYNSVTVDGVNISDTFGLESNNLPTAKQPISVHAIQSVQVNVSNYDVTQRGYTGANINAVTKSGTNEFHGDIYYSHRDENMAGKRFSRTTGAYTDPAPFKETLKGFTLGGPILQDKLFFFVGYEESKSSKTSVEYGPIGSPLTNVGITNSAIDALRSVATNTWGIDLGTSTPPSGVFTTVKDSLVRLDWTISDAHRAMFRWTKTEQNEPFYSNFGTRALSLGSHWYQQEKSLETTVAQWFADWSPSFSTEARVSFRDYASEPLNASTLPTMAFDFGGTASAGATGDRTLWSGTERSRHFNQLFTKTYDAFLGATWTLGAHELKFGGELSQNKIFNAFLQDANGQYKFQCESAYVYSTGPIDCATATAAAVEAAVIENFRLGRPSAYQAQLPRSGKTLDDGVAKWKINNYGLFLQDSFKPVSGLTITAGARIDMIDMPDKPQANAAAAAAKVDSVVTGLGTGTRQTGGFGRDNTVTPDGDTLLQPRLGFNWDLGGKERKLQVRGGAGLFQGAAANVWISNPYSNPGVAMAFYGCGPSNELSGGTNNRAACANTATGGVFSPDPTNQPALGSNPAANVDFLADGLTQPSVWKLNFGVDAELPWFGLVAGAEWIHTKVKDGIYYEHLNLGSPTGQGKDGRDLFYNANGFNRNCWSATGSVTATATGCGGSVSNRALNNASFGNVLLAKSSKKGGGDAITIGLAQQPIPGLVWQVAYTRTNATEVSPLTSSVSNSNWAARSIFNPNEEVAAKSAYLVRDRVSGTMSWSKAYFGSYKTSFGVTYEGRRGKPYSWTYYNDLNGDGQSGNDLMYIPSAPGSGEVIFNGGATEEAKFWEIVNANSELSAAKGGVVSRNSSTAPWTNNLDVRMSQELPGFMSGHKARIKFDILNFGNLLNKKWGHIDEVAFQSAGGAARSFVNYKGLEATTGKYVYSLGNLEDYTTRQAKGESQWALQISLEYEF